MGTWASTGWAVQPWDTTADLMWVGLDEHLQTQSRWAMGVTATAGWAVGAADGPVTRRTDTPLTREFVVAETWAAQVSMDEAPEEISGDPSTRALARREIAALGVAWREPARCGLDYAEAVWRTLRWLMGTGGQQVPYPVPLRHPDGTLLTAQDLYERAIADQPWRYRLPEQRHELRHATRRQARRSDLLAQRVQAVIDRVQAGAGRSPRG